MTDQQTREGCLARLLRRWRARASERALDRLTDEQRRDIGLGPRPPRPIIARSWLRT